ncbi:MAG TPA: HD domain-containing phosphohydrolase [Solirubrobacteraceae bacterium]|nr:HD domain-containing phosphohydrolase [Solirubrobacteraceae bacterium]
MSVTTDALEATDPTLAAAEAFNAAAAAAADATTPRAFLTGALGQLAGLLAVSACAILAAEESGLRCVASVGLPAKHLPRVDAAPPGPSGTLGPAIAWGEEMLAHGFQSSWSVALSLPDGRTGGAFVAFEHDPGPPSPAVLELASAYGSVIARGLDRLDQESTLAARYHAVVVALTSALDARDEYTGRHSAETSELAVRVGERLGMSDGEQEVLAQIAVLHDVGKLGVPTDVLLKQGPLDRSEQALMREHPVIGERILSGIDGLSEVARAVRCEHERWDGHGYPDGLAGEQIPLAARVVFACDAWHAMTSDRPYRPAMPHAEALEELRRGAGTQFDPRVAKALLEILGDQAGPPACSPSESRDRALSQELTAIALEIGASDLFVFRRVADRHYSHLGGVGRGAGWAGNIELDPRRERYVSAALARGEPVCVELARPGRIVGPYWGRSAVVVPCDEDTAVIFGSPTDSVAGACTERSAELAERVRALVSEVSPTKRLADELEVLAAVREITTVNADGMGETLVSIAARARAALAAEFAAVATVPSGDVDAAIGIDAGAWQPRDLGAGSRVLSRFAAASAGLPMLCQDVSELADAPEGFRAQDGVCSLHVLPIGSPAIAVLLVAHTEPGLRGFTDLCLRVAAAISEAAEPVVRRVIAQECLQAENARLGEQLRTDALTGVASRSAWEEALREEEAHGPSTRSPVSVVIVDVDGLKAVNDESGHGAGDDLLCRCAALLAAAVRSTDLVARIGGDEFGVLLRYTDERRAGAWCEELGARMEAAGPVRWSLGCASVPPRGSVAATVAAADRAMYVMKSRARALPR